MRRTGNADIRKFSNPEIRRSSGVLEDSVSPSGDPRSTSQQTAIPEIWTSGDSEIRRCGDQGMPTSRSSATPESGDHGKAQRSAGLLGPQTCSPTAEHIGNDGFGAVGRARTADHSADCGLQRINPHLGLLSPPSSPEYCLNSKLHFAVAFLGIPKQNLILFRMGQRLNNPRGGGHFGNLDTGPP